jgi:glycosyltransferase involved in cell wall biosynthesis
MVADELRRLAPHAHVVAAPLTVDPLQYVRATLAGPPTVGFIGTGTWPPAAAAAKRLVFRVWPHVRRNYPEARLLIAGRGTDALGLPEGDGVEVMGAVPTASAFFGQLSLLLYPVERGSGMKVKVLEALASGVPVVTTESGVEGIEADGGIVIESDDKELADAAVAILR